jgi:hypothetical protein
MFGCLSVFACVCMVCESLKVHSTPTMWNCFTIEGDQLFMACHQQLHLLECFVSLVTIMQKSRLKLVVEIGLKYTNNFQKHFCKLCDNITL